MTFSDRLDEIEALSKEGQAYLLGWLISAVGQDLYFRALEAAAHFDHDRDGLRDSDLNLW